MEFMIDDMIDCVICGAAISGWGHNPDPISTTGRCCDSCNYLVIVKRLKQINEQSNK
jgi:hypothetical protein|tara:strand:+ start:181 stop:351 length:171 start_codon:yes stop_codon:yes gene_type:complete